MAYLAKTLSRRKTPQSEKIPGSKQTRNSAGGYGYAVDDWTRLDRFLILGSEGGSYYASQSELTIENATATLACISADGERVVRRVVEISEGGRAAKNDPAILVLALCLTHGTLETKRAATVAVPAVCRIGTHLFTLVSHIDAWKTWNRTTRRAVAGWYTGRDAASLGYQMVKYQRRGTWSHHDVMHLAHPKFASESHQTLAAWAKTGWESVGDAVHPDAALRQVWAYERARHATPLEVARLVREYRLPREAVGSEHLNDAGVWEALLESEMPYTALIRNLAKMTSIGLIAPLSSGAREIVRRLGDTEAMRRARVHPIALLTALKVYEQGHGEKGSLKWDPVAEVIDALDAAFYAAFQTITPSGKRHVLALDVSGSMGMGSVGGVSSLTPRIAAGALALVTAAVEAATTVVAFSHELVPLAISPRQRLPDVLRAVDAIPMGGTDCALPMIWAQQNRIEADVFVCLTDSETWAGQIHPTQALADYRQATGIPAKLAVLAMVSSGFSIADPEDAGMMDLVGFDTATPAVLADFVRA